jgi:hypothetical protein
MMARKQFDKMLSLLSVWHDLIEAAKATPGTRYMLEPTTTGRGMLREKPFPDDEPPPVPPGYLFPK